ncbi:hypothetical protein J31TS4_25120 [Paenibacillus sp. J31TS4]|nr:hypothetical protein J31TS4_25120 [Paenibacillus sp. J31TS4]
MISKIQFDIMKRRKLFFTLSTVLTILGIVSLLTLGLNRGVDFKAGTTLDITSQQTMDRAAVNEILSKAGYEDVNPTVGGKTASIRFDKVLAQEETEKIVSGFKAVYGEGISKEENTVDVQLANELALKAIYAVLIASVGISLYVSIRFEWRFAIGAIVSTLYDAFLVITLFSLFRLEVNLPFVAAVLTIVGYSINDTIVIFDRIRENQRFSKLRNEHDLADLVNKSIWQTMTRSINTVLTVLIGAVCLWIFGSEGIRHFSLAMIFGLLSGAYSSIFIASPIWFVLKKKTIGTGRKPAAAKD